MIRGLASLCSLLFYYLRLIPGYKIAELAIGFTSARKSPFPPLAAQREATQDCSRTTALTSSAAARTLSWLTSRDPPRGLRQLARNSFGSSSYGFKSHASYMPR